MLKPRTYTPSFKVVVLTLLLISVGMMHMTLNKLSPNYLRSFSASVFVKKEIGKVRVTEEINMQDFGSCFKQETAIKDSATGCAKSFNLEQDSEVVVSYVRKYHLIPPSPLSYNMTPFSSTTFDAFKEPGNMISRQDKRVLELLNKKTDGFFIEAGANDGLFRSNSLDLERDYNWRGLLVEADPRPLSALVKRHRQAWISDVCLSITPFPNKMAMQRNKKVEAISHIVEPGSAAAGDFESFEVNCFPLYTILVALGVTEIDYFSMDMEGVELQILKTLPFDKINIKIISIEITNEVKRNEITDFLTPKGYVKDEYIVDRYNYDQIYIKQNLKVI